MIIEKLITWRDYKNIVNALKEFDFLYRGHEDSKWKLNSTFHREAKHKNVTMDQYIKEIIPDVYLHISDRIVDNFNLDDSNDFNIMLSLIRHHGFPTPLLDWTYSPYIAAFFAFKDVNDISPRSDYVKIYILFKDNASDIINSSRNTINNLLSEKQFISILRPLAKHNPRFIPQQCVYTISNANDIEDYIKSLAGDPQHVIGYYHLSVKEKPEVIQELNMMGINEHTLFPGLDGTCASLRKKYFSRDIVGSTPRERKNLSELVEKYFEEDDK